MSKINPLGLGRAPEPVTDITKKQIKEEGEQLGFYDREPQRKKPGRKPSRRQGQIQGKTHPEYAEFLSQEITRRDTTRGVILEQAIDLYCEKHGLPIPYENK